MFCAGAGKKRFTVEKVRSKSNFCDKQKNVYVSDGLDFELTDDAYKIVKKDIADEKIYLPISFFMIEINSLFFSAGFSAGLPFNQCTRQC